MNHISRTLILPGNDDYVDSAWELKELIRRQESVFHQCEDFFRRVYKQSFVYVCIDTENDELAGFASFGDDGYIFFIAVHPNYRGEGYGREMVKTIFDNSSIARCHVRATNENAIQFYQHTGFEFDEYISGYYSDGGDAYYIELEDFGNSCSWGV